MQDATSAGAEIRTGRSRIGNQGYFYEPTVDADEMLGFGPDRRRFHFAAGMLRQLGIGRVWRITNNPDKIAALTQAGIDVVAHERSLGRRTVLPSNLSAITRTSLPSCSWRTTCDEACSHFTNRPWSRAASTRASSTTRRS